MAKEHDNSINVFAAKRLRGKCKRRHALYKMGMENMPLLQQVLRADPATGSGVCHMKATTAGAPGHHGHELVLQKREVFLRNRHWLGQRGLDRLGAVSKCFPTLARRSKDRAGRG